MMQRRVPRVPLQAWLGAGAVMLLMVCITMPAPAQAFGNCNACVYVLEQIKKGTNMLLPAICSEVYLKYPASYATCHQVLNSISLNANNVRYWLWEGCYKNELYNAREWIKPCPSHVICAILKDVNNAPFCPALPLEKPWNDDGSTPAPAASAQQQDTQQQQSSSSRLGDLGNSLLPGQQQSSATSGNDGGGGDGGGGDGGGGDGGGGDGGGGDGGGDTKSQTQQQTQPQTRSIQVQQQSAPSSGCGAYEGAATSTMAGNDNVQYTVVRIRPEHFIGTNDNTMTVQTSCAFGRMADAAKAAGVSIKINSGFRTLASQQQIWKGHGCAIVSGKTKCTGAIAAVPGRSNHGRGTALDLNTGCNQGSQSAPPADCQKSAVYKWLQANAGKYGFHRAVPSEPWHWEYVGGTPSVPPYQ